MNLMQELRGCAHRDNLYARALARILELEADNRTYAKTMSIIAALPPPPSPTSPIPMVLFCPRCHLQHIDAPDERTPDWTNPPHKSHLCHGCGCIWRPADVPTEGVEATATVGKADNWTPSPTSPTVEEADSQ